MVEDYYRMLERKFPAYADLRHVPSIDNGEPLVSLGATEIASRCFDERMHKYTGEEIYVRESLVEMLNTAQDFLGKIASGAYLEVVYGYRHLEIQTESFEEIKRGILEVQPEGWTEETLIEEASFSIAAPQVAGHPTGGAIDICIKDETGTEWDMGTALHEFVKDTYVHSPFISRGVWFNRQLLRHCMTAAGFAPFDGEWWHFSYGDKEWAFYYNQPHALYDQLSFEA